MAEKLEAVNWEATVSPLEQYLKRGSTITETHRRALKLQQFMDLAEFVQTVLAEVEIIDPHPQFSVGRITWQNVNLYHMNDLFVKKLTLSPDTGDTCSFVELVASGPQDPVWFISHWWGTVFSKTIQKMSFHAKARSLQPDSTYWMCTFANNQHALGELDDPDMLHTPFARAILFDSCHGTVVFLDAKATPFHRAWCVLEAYVTREIAKKERPFLMDVASIVEGGSQIRDGRRIATSAVLLKDDGSGEMHDVCECKGARLPYSVAKESAHISIQTAQATNAEDKHNILRLIVGETDVSKPIPESHPQYDVVNGVIQRMFAPRALFAYALDKDTDEVRRLLAGSFCHPDARTEDGTTAMHVAAQLGDIKTMECLLEFGADPQPLNDNKASPAVRAAQHNRVGALQVLLDAKADIHIPNQKGNTPLDFGAGKGCTKACAFLLQHGANVNQANHSGRTPLMNAAAAGKDGVVKVLLDARADATMQMKGETALDMAKNSEEDGADACVALLTEAMEP